MGTQHLMDTDYNKRKFLYIYKDEQEKSFMDFTRSLPKMHENSSTMKKLAPAAAIGLGLLRLTNPLTAVSAVATTAGLQYALDIESRRKQELEEATFYAVRSQVYGVLFPGDGIPLNHVTYICNPIDTRRYYPVNEFHKAMFDHKVYEAKYLLRSLGAIEINVIASEETSRNFDFNTSNGPFSSNNNFSKQNHSHFNFSSTYEPSGNPPFIPEDVYWIDHEPQWKIIANERLNNGLKSFELKVEVTSDFGINSQIAALLPEGNVSVNGKYNEFKKASFVLAGKFS